VSDPDAFINDASALEAVRAAASKLFWARCPQLLQLVLSELFSSQDALAEELGVDPAT
jgi:hypothetical protein